MPGHGEQFVMMVSVTLTPEYFAINLALGKLAYYKLSVVRVGCFVV